MSSVEDIISYKRRPDEDFYGLLNCDENSSNEQIQAEYKVLALQYHPDKNDGNKEAECTFQKLKIAKETLTDPEKRINYDKWRNSGINISYKNWLGMKEHVQQSMHWSKPKTKDRMLTEPDGACNISGSSGSSDQSKFGQNFASECASTFHYCGPSKDIAAKFRNYEI